MHIDAPVLSWYVDATQLVHPVEALAEYAPGWQLEQFDAPELIWNIPVLQLKHPPAPLTEKVPGRHAKQLVDPAVT